MTTMSPPTSPQHHYDASNRPHQPRAVSSMSQASTSSRRSNRSNKLDLTESPKDKKRLHTKADPSRAITEAEPSQIALEDANLEDLRLVQHKDLEGNLIMDPDRSNPTRPRMERPLDTIRSFNAAAEGTSRSRASSYHGRPPSTYGSTHGSEVGGNRRSSYYGSQTYSPSTQRPRYGSGYGNGYYRNSAYGFPQHNLDEMPDEAAYQPPPRQMRNPMGPMYNQQPGYPQPPYAKPNDSPMSGQHSYETMTSGSDENGKSTNPSSLNSSYDHLHQMQMRKQENHAFENHYNNEINFAPVSPQQLYTNYGNANGNAHQQNGNTHVRDYDPYSGPSGSNGNYGAPRPPAKEYIAPPVNNPRQPIKLNGPSSPPPTEQKRKSWLKRTFSRNN